jgi:hypothetical protein
MQLPPLPLQVLGEVENIEEMAQTRLSFCWSTHGLNIPKAIRILSSCVVQVFDAQARYYVSLPDCSERWLELLESNTRAVAIGFCSAKGLTGLASQEYEQIDYELRGALTGPFQKWLENLLQVKSSAVIQQASEGEPQHEVSLPAEVARRKKQLEDYKTATGQPSNRSIYTAKNSGVHKPEFYAYLSGELPETSQMFKNFERFLRDKKKPIPKAK